MAEAAGVTEGSPVRVTVEPGRILIETEVEPSLDQMLAAFDPDKQGGEAMAGGAAGVEAFAHGGACVPGLDEPPRIQYRPVGLGLAGSHPYWPGGS